MSGFLGPQILVAPEPGSVDNLVINLNVEKCVDITDAYEESPAHAAETLGIRWVHKYQCWLL